MKSKHNVSTFDIGRRPHTRPNNPHIWALFLYDSNLNSQESTDRIFADMKWLNSLFVTECNYNLTIATAGFLDNAFIKLNKKAQDIDSNIKLSDIEDLNTRRNIVIQHNSRAVLNPPISVMIIYRMAINSNKAI